MAANIRTDIQRDRPRFHDPAIFPQGRRLETALQIDREIDAFPQVELPDDTAAPEDADIALAGERSQCPHNSRNQRRQRNFLPSVQMDSDLFATHRGKAFVSELHRQHTLRRCESPRSQL
jgi:hypothetical protein